LIYETRASQHHPTTFIGECRGSTQKLDVASNGAVSWLRLDTWPSGFPSAVAEGTM